VTAADHPLRPPIAVAGDAVAEPPVDRSLDVRASRVRAIVEASYDFLWRCLRHFGVPEAGVEDAAQQVLVVVARRIDEIGEGKERAFLLACALRAASEARRASRRRREVAAEDALDAIAAETPSLDELLDQRRARDALVAVLGTLPDDLRTVFVLFELEEMTAPEIARLLSIAPGTVASRLRRAREMFGARVRRLEKALGGGDEKGGSR
jgi:RNA polymerase sigma-70 factor (ECF subfamily)